MCQKYKFAEGKKKSIYKLNFNFKFPTLLCLVWGSESNLCSQPPSGLRVGMLKTWQNSSRRGMWEHSWSREVGSLLALRSIIF